MSLLLRIAATYLLLQAHALTDRERERAKPLLGDDDFSSQELPSDDVIHDDVLFETLPRKLQSKPHNFGLPDTNKDNDASLSLLTHLRKTKRPVEELFHSHIFEDHDEEQRSRIKRPRNEENYDDDKFSHFHLQPKTVKDYVEEDDNDPFDKFSKSKVNDSENHRDEQRLKSKLNKKHDDVYDFPEIPKTKLSKKSKISPRKPYNYDVDGYILDKKYTTTTRDKSKRPNKDRNINVPRLVEAIINVESDISRPSKNITFLRHLSVSRPDAGENDNITVTYESESDQKEGQFNDDIDLDSLDINKYSQSIDSESKHFDKDIYHSQYEEDAESDVQEIPKEQKFENKLKNEDDQATFKRPNPGENYLQEVHISKAIPMPPQKDENYDYEDDEEDEKIIKSQHANAIEKHGNKYLIDTIKYTGSTPDDPYSELIEESEPIAQEKLNGYQINPNTSPMKDFTTRDIIENKKILLKSLIRFKKLTKMYNVELLKFIPSVIPGLISAFKISIVDEEDDEYNILNKSDSDFRSKLMYLSAKQEVLDSMYSTNLRDILYLYNRREKNGMLYTLIRNAQQSVSVAQSMKTEVLSLSRRLRNASRDYDMDTIISETLIAPGVKRKARLLVGDQISRYIPNLNQIKERRRSGDLDSETTRLILALGKHRFLNPMIYNNLKTLLNYLGAQLRDEGLISVRSLDDSNMYDIPGDNAFEGPQYSKQKVIGAKKLMVQNTVIQYGQFVASRVASEFLKDVHFLFGYLSADLYQSASRHKPTADPDPVQLHRMACNRLKAAIEEKIKELPRPLRRSRQRLYKGISDALLKYSMTMTEESFKVAIREEASKVRQQLKSILSSKSNLGVENALSATSDDQNDDEGYSVKSRTRGSSKYRPREELEEEYEELSGSSRQKTKKLRKVQSKSISNVAISDEWNSLLALLSQTSFPSLTLVRSRIRNAALEQSYYISNQVTEEFGSELRYVYSYATELLNNTMSHSINDNTLQRIVTAKNSQFINQKLAVESLLQRVGIQRDELSKALLQETSNEILKVSIPIAIDSVDKGISKEADWIVSKYSSAHSSEKRETPPSKPSGNFTIPLGPHGPLKIEMIKEGFKIGNERVNIDEDIVHPSQDILKSLRTNQNLNIFEHTNKKGAETKVIDKIKYSSIISYIEAKLLEDFIRQADLQASNNLTEEQKIGIKLSRFYIAKRTEDSTRNKAEKNEDDGTSRDRPTDTEQEDYAQETLPDEHNAQDVENSEFSQNRTENLNLDENIPHDPKDQINIDSDNSANDKITFNSADISSIVNDTVQPNVENATGNSSTPPLLNPAGRWSKPENESEDDGKFYMEGKVREVLYSKNRKRQKSSKSRSKKRAEKRAGSPNDQVNNDGGFILNQGSRNLPTIDQNGYSVIHTTKTHKNGARIRSQRNKKPSKYKNRVQNDEASLRSFTPLHDEELDKYTSIFQYQDNNGDYDENDEPIAIAKFITHQEALSSSHKGVKDRKSKYESEDLHYGLHPSHNDESHDGYRPKQLKQKSNSIRSFKPFYGEIPEKYRSILNYQEENNKDYGDTDLPILVAKLNTHEEKQSSVRGTVSHPNLDFQSSILQTRPHLDNEEYSPLDLNIW